MKKLINRAVKRYKYHLKVNDEECLSDFYRQYDFWTKKDNLKNYPHIIWGVLLGLPGCTHIKAKNLLFQGNDDCWKYFERTAVFWTYAYLMNDPWIDRMKGEYEYALYVERKDLIELLFERSLSYLTDEENLSNKEFKKQKVYPSTQFVHFLIEKWLGKNPVKELILNYGNGYGIYQKIIDNWEDLSVIESEYWDELCVYHLKGMSLYGGEKWENEEFLASGLVPMEIINLIKVRQELGLDIPTINNDLFDTNMAKMPIIPTGYNENSDPMFKLVDLTVKTQKKYSFDEINESEG